MDSDFFFKRVDLLDHRQVFKDDKDFMTYVHLLRWMTINARGDCATSPKQ
jgi:hypothetical protein